MSRFQALEEARQEAARKWTPYSDGVQKMVGDRLIWYVCSGWMSNKGIAAVLFDKGKPVAEKDKFFSLTEACAWADKHVYRNGKFNLLPSKRAKLDIKVRVSKADLIIARRVFDIGPHGGPLLHHGKVYVRKFAGEIAKARAQERRKLLGRLIGLTTKQGSQS